MLHFWLHLDNTRHWHRLISFCSAFNADYLIVLRARHSMVLNNVAIGEGVAWSTSIYSTWPFRAHDTFFFLGLGSRFSIHPDILEYA